MKKYFLGLLLLATAGVIGATCNVVIKFNQIPPDDYVILQYAKVDNLINAKTPKDLKITVDTLQLKTDSIVFPLKQDDNYRYNLVVTKGKAFDFYSMPGENLRVTVESIVPFKYTVYGSDMMNGLTELQLAQAPLEEDAKLIRSGQNTETSMEDLVKKYKQIFKDYIDKNPSSPAAVFALLNLSGQEFLDYQTKLDSTLVNNMLYPMVEDKSLRESTALAADKYRDQLVETHTAAPDFSLPDLEGKTVSLSQFKGKWVILDFWGSWCGWCIKGFPKLKEAYEMYKDKLEVIGIDCQEPEEAWKKGVEKFKLPWVNVYNTEKELLLKKYGVQGFPTKVIIDPDGNIVNITSGEDPEFYNSLAKFMDAK